MDGTLKANSNEDAQQTIGVDQDNNDAEILHTIAVYHHRYPLLSITAINITSMMLGC